MKCHDCPDLVTANMPPDWTPRATCCVDDLIERRMAGEHIDFTTPEDARKASDERLANLSRQARRYEERKGKR